MAAASSAAMTAPLPEERRSGFCGCTAIAMTNDSDQGSPLRSMLFVPGDSEKKLAKSGQVPADALILDLEDAVDPARKAAARELVADSSNGAPVAPSGCG